MTFLVGLASDIAECDLMHHNPDPVGANLMRLTSSIKSQYQFPGDLSVYSEFHVTKMFQVFENLGNHIYMYLYMREAFVCFFVCGCACPSITHKLPQVDL